MIAEVYLLHIALKISWNNRWDDVFTYMIKYIDRNLLGIREYSFFFITHLFWELLVWRYDIPFTPIRVFGCESLRSLCYHFRIFLLHPYKYLRNIITINIIPINVWDKLISFTETYLKQVQLKCKILKINELK
jgi:hypothetical protein